MKKILTSLFALSLIGTLSAQWSPTTYNGDNSGKKKTREVRAEALDQARTYFKLDIASIKAQLKNAQEMGSGAKPVVISIPTLDGKISKFNVYSFPVVVKELADQYDLGSYAGVSVDNPSEYIRFSVAPNDFQSMLFRNGNYEFIEPVDKTQGIYSVHPKTKKSGDKPFICTTEEKSSAVKDLENLSQGAKTFTHNPGDFSKNSDKKYRTMRLALSVTGEYTAYHGGTVPGALAAMNATLTRVNGVFEKDFALHLNLQNFPDIIYTNGATDPYSDSTSMQNWNVELQNNLTTVVGNANYDIGHLFGHSGGGGNAGCIGCVCIAPTSTTLGKGSGYTSPANSIPMGDTFDIDYVAHELGHQLGANHTFSHAIEGTGMNVEPGSGSTIMGYAGITGGPNTDVQANSDAYFHRVSIGQVQTNLISKTCDVETAVNNNPPVIPNLPSYTIPKKTAFVLSANVTDPENDPMTFTWEQVDSGMTQAQTINKNNLGQTTYGGSFRSNLPSTSPTRYFPKFSSVLAGALDNSLNTWESTSQVARSTSFALTARDNNANVLQQQTNSATQAITVGNDGPFQITTGYLFSNAPSNLLWDVVNTAAAPYNVANVKIDYSTDNGVNWTVLSASTPNDGSESFTMPATLNGQTIVMRVSSIGNVFYAIKKIQVTTQITCGSTPIGVSANNITGNSATISWPAVSGAASYSLQYKLSSASTWTTVPVSSTSYDLTNLTDCTPYQVQIAAICSGTTGAYSAPITFTTTCVQYCTVASTSGQYNYISNVNIGSVNNTSVGSTYTNYTTNTALQPTLLRTTPINMSMTMTVTNAGLTHHAGAAWIDYNHNGVFEPSERVLNMLAVPVPVGTKTTTATINIPTSALNGPTRMRVIVVAVTAASEGAQVPESFACGTFSYGEVEDYNVNIVPSLGTSEVSNANDGIKIYPNPVSDVLNITKVSDKAEFSIHNATGQLVDTGIVKNGKIDVTSLIKGVYVITIKDGNRENFTSKFIKK